jgi:hypothetical protein
MRARLALSFIGCAALIGCAYATGKVEPVPPLETITYETGACYGRCPVFRIVVNNKGDGLFTGVRFTAVRGERRFKITPAQFQKFKSALDPYLRFPFEDRYEPGQPSCKDAVTDMPSVDIKYTLSDRPGTAHLTFYYGCDPEKYRPMAEALSNAPNNLLIADLIGKR